MKSVRHGRYWDDLSAGSYVPIMTPVVDLAVGELQPGVLAVTSASPPEPASRRNRVAVIAAAPAAGAALVPI